MRFILALTALLIASVAPAAAQFRAVIIDTSAMSSRGYPIFARRVEAAVAPAVAHIFAGQVNPGDPRGLTLIVRILDVSMPVISGSSSGNENDYMLSEGVLVDAGGRVVASTIVPSTVSAWTTVASLPIEIEEHRRMRQLGLSAAGWMRTRLGGF